MGRNCSGLSSITLGDNVATIGGNAFCGTNLDNATQAAIRAINPDGVCSSE